MEAMDEQPKPWTPEEDRLLWVRLPRTPYGGYKVIAALTGRSVIAVRNRTRRLRGWHFQGVKSPGTLRPRGPRRRTPWRWPVTAP